MPLRTPLALSVLAALAVLIAVPFALAAPGAGWELRGFLAPDFAGPAGASSGGILPAGWLLPPIELRSGLRMVHLAGLCLGFGTAVLLDGSALAWIRSGRAPDNAASLLSVGGHLVLVGFALLWASGVALATLAVEADPSFLASPKLWAKVLIVTALTANAVVLHARVLPPFALSTARALDGRWRGRERSLFVACGAVSSASWVLAFALGVLREWNHGAPFGFILLLWLIGMLMAAVAIQILLPAPVARAPYRGRERRRGVRAEAGRALEAERPLWPARR